MIKNLWPVLFFLLFSQYTSALEVGLLGGVSYWRPNSAFSSGLVESVNSKSKAMLVVGASMEQRLTGLLSIELDALYVRKKGTISGSIPSFSAVFDNTVEMKSIHLPFLIRLNLVPSGLINLGVGGYYEIGMAGGVTATDNTIPETVTESYGQSNLKHNDYGLLGSLRFKLPLTPRLKFVVDGRYLKGLVDQIPDPGIVGESMKVSYIQAMGGLSFNF